MDTDVPMLFGNKSEHIKVSRSRRRLGPKHAFSCKANCSITKLCAEAQRASALRRKVAVNHIPAISGAGKTFADWPEIIDNVIPYIGGEEEKSEREPMKVWGRIENGVIVPVSCPSITAQCIRVPASDGHLAAVFVSFDKKPSKEQIIAAWESYSGLPQKLELPSAPKQFIKYFEEDNRPQTALDRGLENGMGISAGRLREDSVFDYKFIGLSHNTLRGAAGGACSAPSSLQRINLK